MKAVGLVTEYNPMHKGHVKHFEKSKELLRQTNMKVSDVAEKVGYLNVSYYISIFRNHEGCSPVQYRERVQNGE